MRGWCVRSTAGVLFTLATLSSLSAARGQAPDAPIDEPLNGCGKGRAMAALYEADLAAEREPGARAAREAMQDTDVLHYELDLEISNLNPTAFNCLLTGTNTMTIRSKSAALTTVTIRLRENLAITSAVVNGATPVAVATLDVNTRQVALDRAYGMDEEFTLTMGYGGTSVPDGFGSILCQSVSGVPVVESLSEPFFAHTWWPVKDGPAGQPGDQAEKSTIDLTITAPAGYKIPSNGVLQSSETLPDGRVRWHWATAYPIAPYLVSFAAANYNTWTLDYAHAGGTMPVEFFIYPHLDNASNRNQWGKSLDMMAAFRPLYGEYPFINEKYGIYNFTFGGGMEHQTITGQSSFSESLTAHELSHQWWGDMVTCRTWSDIWLNEGFATYSECIWQEYRTGVQNLNAYFSAVQARKPSWFAMSVYVPPSTLNMSRIFSTNFSYNKGCWVLHQLRGLVGDETFFEILRNYREMYAYSAATTDDFAAVASATFGQDLTWFFDQWVYQIGAPTYLFGWQSTIVEGQNYLVARIAQAQAENFPEVFVMPVPLRVTIGGVQSTLNLWNDARTQWFVVPTSGEVTTATFDPNQWILRKSLTNESYIAGPPKVVAAAPGPGATLDVAASPNELRVTFHTPVDVGAGDVVLIGERHGPRAVTIASGAGANPLVLQLDGPLAADEYTLTLGEGIVASNSGMAIDGEIAESGALPSGDGVPGGAAVIRFAVVSDVVGDVDGDGDVDLVDFSTFSTCFSGTGNTSAPAGCNAADFAAADLNGDGSVDLGDFATFAAEFSS